MGMDWHSSGITTSVIGALKRGLAPVQDELGIYVCGGRGRHSRQTPDELLAVAERTGADGAGLARTSRLVAKVDSAAVQDGFELYLHGFFVTRGGAWTVVQQGMLPSARLARRYHWKSAGLTSFVDDPHAAVEGPSRGQIVNLADARARRSRGVQLELIAAGPDRVLAQLQTLRVLRQAVDGAQLGNDDKLCAIRELDRQARVLERTAQAPSFAEYVDRERRASPRLGGKTV
jgi:hypothetical protein